MATTNDLLKQIETDKTVERSFMVPINEILSELKTVKAKKGKPEHLEMTVVVPLDLAKNIHEFYNCGWGLALLGIKTKKGGEEQ